MKSKLYKRFRTNNFLNISEVLMICMLASSISILPVNAQQIIPDGKTQTTLSVNQNVTNVTTNTIKGNNAFNSFARFNVNTGNVVNLNVPETATRLINVVHGEVSSINGVLNSIQNGHIAGNIYLVNPNGIFVGPQGVINTGSLTAITPTKQFTDNFFNSNGTPDDVAVTALINGTSPINPIAVVGIEGKINALTDINIQTGSLSHAGEMYSGSVFKENNVQMGDVVNCNTLENANNIAVNNGTITIKALKDITTTGKIIADGGNNLNATNISLVADNNITVKNASYLSARGKGDNSNGGNIYIFASKKADFESGALIAAKGGNNSGNAGFIEFSAKDIVNIIGGEFDTSAVNGKSGTVLVDPWDLVIDPAYFGYPPPYKVNQDYNFTADHNITIQNITTYTYDQGSTGTIRLTAGNDLLATNNSIDVGSVYATVGNNSTINTSKIVARNMFDVRSGTITSTDSKLGGDFSNFIQTTKGDMTITNTKMTAADANDYLHLGNNSTYSIVNNLTMNNNLKTTFTSTGTLDITIGNSVNLINTGITGGTIKLNTGGNVTMANSTLTSNTTGTFNTTIGGNLLVHEILAPKGHLNVQTTGNIIDNNAVSENPNFSGNNITLNSTGGTIGTANDNINIHSLSNPSLIALANTIINIGSLDNIYVNVLSNAGRDNIYLNSTYGIYTTNSSIPTNIYGKSVNLTAVNGSIGASGSPLIVDTNYQTTGGFLTTSAFGNTFIKEASGDLNVQSIKSTGGGNATIYGLANILDDAQSAQSAITAKNLFISTTGGTVGSANNPLDIEVNKFNTGGSLITLASGLINLNQLTGNLCIDVVSNAGKADVKINSTQGSILDGSTGEVPNIYGKNLTLNAPNGSIGLFSDDVNIYTDYANTGGVLNAGAYSLINLCQKTTNLWVDRIQSTAGDVKLTGDASLLDGRATEDANLIGKNIVLNTVYSGSIGLFGDDVNFSLNGGTMSAQAFGYIFLNAVTGNFNLDFVSNAGRSDVNLVSVGSILDGSTGELPNVYSNNVLLNAQSGTVGSTADNINMDSNYLNTGGAVTAFAQGFINLQENTGVLNIDVLSNAGRSDVQLVSDQSFIDKNSTENPNIYCKSLNLYSINGGVGAANDNINIYTNYNTTGGTLSAYAMNGVMNLAQTTGDLYIYIAQSSGNSTLTANGSMLNFRSDIEANIVGRDINLTATTGNLGAANKHLRVKSSTGVVQTQAGQNTYVDQL